MKLPSLKLGSGWVRIVVLSEPDVTLTFKGYVPVLRVRADRTSLEYLLYLSAKSLGEQLEPLRQQNNGRFTGLTIDIRKASTEKTAPYEIRRA